jgi:hypothetical protein
MRRGRMDRYKLCDDGFDDQWLSEYNDGDYVKYIDAQQAIATARTEALSEAADSAVYAVGLFLPAREITRLRNAILTDKQEGKNG